MVAVFQEDTFYTQAPFFTFKTKLRHLNKKWYPGVVQLMHTVVCYYRQPKQVSKNCLLPGTHLYVIYDIYVKFPTTPYEIIKMSSIVSFDKLYNEYLG